MFLIMVVLLQHKDCSAVNGLLVMEPLVVEALLKGVLQIFMWLSLCCSVAISAPYLR